MEKLKVGLVGTYQKNFNINLALQKLRESIEFLEDLSQKEGFHFYPISKGIVHREDVVRAKKELEDKKIDFLLVQNCSISAGDNILPFAGMRSYLGLWSIPEPTEEGSLPLASFVGSNMYASIIGHYLADYDIPFKWFFGAPQDRIFLDRFKLTLKVLKALKSLANSHIALIGGVAPGFYDLYLDQRNLQSIYGVSISSHELSEVLEKARAYPESKVEKIVKQIKSEGKNTNIDDETFARATRVYLALGEIVKNNGYQALALSCWPKFQSEYGLAPCSIVGRLNQNGIVVACEGDISGALSMLLSNYLNQQCSTLMDLPKFDWRDESLLMWHCGPAAKCWADNKGITYRTHFSLGTQEPGQPVRGVGIVNDMTFKSGPITITRITNEGTKIFLATGKIMDKKKKSYYGSGGWVSDLKIGFRSVSALDFVNTIMVNRVQHHFTLAFGNLTEEMIEMASWLQIQPLEAVPYQKYMQNPH